MECSSFSNLTYLGLSKIDLKLIKYPLMKFSWIKCTCTLIQISLKSIPKGPFHYRSALVEVMAWCKRGDITWTNDPIHWHTLQWCHNERDGISNHQPHNCLPNRLFNHRSKKTSKFRFTGLCEVNSPVTGQFPAQRASNSKMFPFDYVIMYASASLNHQEVCFIDIEF